MTLFNQYLNSHYDVFDVFQRHVEDGVGNGQVSGPSNKCNEMNCRVKFILESVGLEVNLRAVALLIYYAAQLN